MKTFSYRVLLVVAVVSLMSLETGFAAATCKAKPKDIVDTAVSAGGFKTLAAALQAADLVETLKGAGPFTVFAPTDEAFAKLPQGTLADLLKPENKAKLTAILTYHVRARKGHGCRCLVKLSKAKTVQVLRGDHQGRW